MSDHEIGVAMYQAALDFLNQRFPTEFGVDVQY